MKLPYQLEKLSWKTARRLAESVYPELAKVIDEISPDDTFTLYSASYPYGAMIIDKGMFFVPNAEGQIVPLYQSSFPKDYIEDLDFNGSIPVALVTKNRIESFMEHGDRVIPFTLFGCGDVLALWRIFDKGQSFQAPFWRISSGTRAICMLPKITDKNGYNFFKKKYNLSLQVPKKLRDHWHIFSNIANHPEFKEPWSSEILYFSKKWFVNKDDKAWSRFYHLLLDKVWQESAFVRNKMMFDYFLSAIQEEKNLRPNPYLADTVSHLLAMCTGEIPGFISATDDSAAPISGLQQTFLEDYRLKKYAPVILHTGHFSIANKSPLYYSFEIPTTMQFSPRSNNALNTIAEVREIRHITEIILAEIKNGTTGIEKTPLANSLKKLQIKFFHNEKDSMKEILPASNLASLDESLVRTLITHDPYIFPEFAPFFRGCIGIFKL